MKPISASPLRLLGGRYALNWRNHLLFTIPAFLAAGSFDYERLGGEPALWIAIAILGLIVTIFAIEALRPIVLVVRPGWRRALSVLLVLLWAGFLRGLTIYIFGNSVGVIPESDLLFRLIGGPIFVVSVYAITSSILEGYLNYRHQSAELSRELIRLERARAGYTEDLTRVNSEQRSKVRELLAAPMWELQKKLESAKDPRGVQDALITMQSINNDVVRPLSHELGTRAINVPTGFDSGRNLQLSEVLPPRLRPREHQPLALLIMVVLSVGLNAQIGTTSASRGIEIIVLSLAGILPLFLIERETLGRLNMPLWLAAGSALTLGFGSGALAGYLVQLAGLSATDNFWWQAGIYMVITRLIVLAFGIFSHSWRQTLNARAEVAEELRRINSRLRQQLWLGQKSLAMELHGSVQGTLHALASRLAKMKQPDLAEIGEILELVKQSLSRIENEDYLAGGDFNGLLEDLRELWDGTLELSWEISEQADGLLFDDLGLARCVFEIIRESVTNSVKHGDASKVSIRLWMDQDLMLEVSNNGSLAEDLQGYAGHELLDQLCLSHTLENQGELVVMSARLALSPEYEPQFQI